MELSQWADMASWTAISTPKHAEATMQRIAIIGSAGTGKYTLTRRLRELTGLSVIHLDALYWCPGWVATPDADWETLVEGIASQEKWITDGNYGRTMEPRLERADTVVFLEFPRVVCLWRVFKRWLRFRGRSKPDMAPGCPENLYWEFVRWIWNYPTRSRPRVMERIKGHSADTEIIVFRSQKEIVRFLARLADKGDGSTGSP
jgi:adenylate kinase family enzyme